MNRMQSIFRTGLMAVLAGTLVIPAATAADNLIYAEKDGTLKTVALDTVTKSDGDKFVGYIRVGGRRKSLRIDARQIVELRRGDGDAVNQWSKGLARGMRMMAAGRIANQGTAAGAEETFAKIAYSIEDGTKGQEETERVHPWQNMYGQYYLIEARLKLGQGGNEAKLNEALDAIAQFRKRTAVRLSVSALFYGEEPVRDPMRFLFRTLPALFVGQREPMTLIYVQGEAHADDEAALKKEIEELLARSAAAFLR